jgi:hypothetical protein
LLTYPPVVTQLTSATFTFTGADDASTPDHLLFRCVLDGTVYYECASPKTYTGLTPGMMHTVDIFAEDEAGNRGNVVSYAWTVQKERALNGSFNTFVGKLPKSWVTSQFAPLDGKSTIHQDGAFSVMITGAKGKTKTLTQTIALSGVAGARFDLSFWVKGAAVPAGGICQGQVLLYYGTALKATKTVACGALSSTKFKQVTLALGAANAFNKVVIKFTYSKASGKIWIDKVSLMK